MNITYISKDNHSRLLLFFNGWSAVTLELEAFGYDIAVVSDYRDFRLPDIHGYEEVVVMAWSLGVHAAELALQGSQLAITLTVAVNGTPTPISDTEGIPEAIFKGTADGLTEQTLVKFRRRMGAAEMPRGERPLEDLKAELTYFPAEPVPFRWDWAVISTHDRIFPPENQKRAWQDRAEVLEIEGSHMPDFNALIRRFIINKEQVSRRFAKGRETYADQASVQARMADHLLQLWQKHDHKKEERILEIGVGTGLFTALYEKKFRPSELLLWDISGEGRVESHDAETDLRKMPTESLDVVASACTMQWFNSPAAFLEQVSRVLVPGGLAVLSTFGPKTFSELTEAGVVPLPYLSEEGLRRIVPKEMEVLELHGGLITKVFSTPLDALNHLRQTGVNARPCACSVQELMRRWPRREDGKVSLTYQPIYLILRKL